MKKKKILAVKVDKVLLGELYDEDPEPRPPPRHENKKLEEHYRKSMESWLK